MKTRTENQSALIQELLDEIDSCLVGDQWAVPLDYVLNLLETQREEFYRYVYNRRQRANWTDHLPDSFGPHNTRDLVAFLIDRGLSQAPARFHQAGYYFDEDHLLAWLEFFHSVTLSRMQSHEIDLELLETAVAGCRRFADAVEFYGHCKFDAGECIEFAARLFLERQNVQSHHLSRSTLRAYLREQIHQRNLIWEDLYRSMYEQLRDNAGRLGLASPEELDEFPSGAGGSALAPELTRALQILEMPGNRLPARQSLKQNYRNLLKRFHPDVNPSGQEKTRSLIAAYSLVVSYLDAA